MAEELHERIARIIKEKGTNTNRLAAKSGIPKSKIFRIAKGLTTPNLNTLVTLADALGITLFDLIGSVNCNIPSPFGRFILKDGEVLFEEQEYEYTITTRVLNKSLCSVLAQDKNLTPELQQNSLVMVDRNVKAFDQLPGVYAVFVNGNFVFVRAHRTFSDDVEISTNSDKLRTKKEGNDNVIIVGRVVATGSISSI